MTNLGHIRPLDRNDLIRILEWRNHPSIRKVMFTSKEISLEEHQKWFDKSNGDPKRRLLIVESGREPLGFVQFNSVEPGGVSEWGFYARPHAPKGSGRVLGMSALDFAFDVLGLHKVCGQAVALNHASVRFHKRLGFRQEGELREHHFSEGSYQSILCFGVLDHEWKKHRPSVANTLAEPFQGNIE